MELERASWVMRVRCDKKAKNHIIIEGQKIIQDAVDKFGKIKGTRSWA
jgi:hypothetical protein